MILFLILIRIRIRFIPYYTIDLTLLVTLLLALLLTLFFPDKAERRPLQFRKDKLTGIPAAVTRDVIDQPQLHALLHQSARPAQIAAHVLCKGSKRRPGCIGIVHVVVVSEIKKEMSRRTPDSVCWQRFDVVARPV